MCSFAQYLRTLGSILFILKYVIECEPINHSLVSFFFLLITHVICHLLMDRGSLGWVQRLPFLHVVGCMWPHVTCHVLIRQWGLNCVLLLIFFAGELSHVISFSFLLLRTCRRREDSFISSFLFFSSLLLSF